MDASLVKVNVNHIFKNSEFLAVINTHTHTHKYIY